MKKVTSILSILAIAISVSTFAQNKPIKPGGQGNMEYELKDAMVTSIKENVSTITKVGTGTLSFVKSGNKFTNVVYTDAKGRSSKLVPSSGPAAGAPKLPCNSPIPDACFGSADKSIFLCMCRPTNLSAGGSSDPTAILIGLLLPAVQKVRDAANR